jgi:hypothetical protein
MGISSKIVNSIIFKHIEKIHNDKDLLNHFLKQIVKISIKERSSFVDKLS